MPIPRPKAGQSKDKFISSCMGNKVMNKEYPDQAQRYAICLSSWDRRKKEFNPVTNMETATDEDIEEPKV